MPPLPIQTLRADNPGGFTGTGTNSYLLGAAGRGRVLVDPGPDLPGHAAALMEALDGQELEAILVTHAHLDHSALAPRIAALTGAEVLAFGDARSGLSPRMHHLAEAGLNGGEGSDLAFAPDRLVTDGQVLRLARLEIEVIHTPGHMGGHISLALGDTLLSGDHVMGWSTTIVSPPEGDMAAYMRSLRRLAARDWRRFLPGHGAPVEDPAARLASLIAHRQGREAAVLAALEQGPATAADLALRIYTTTPAALIPAATRNVLAHLIDLADQGAVQAVEGPLAEARFRKT